MPDDDTDYPIPSYQEAVQSQLPALQLLVEMGWSYLPPEECRRLRGGRMGAAILEPVLTDFIRETGRFSFKGAEHVFTENAIANAVQDAVAPLGVERVDMPFTPHRVWALLKDKQIAAE